MRIKFRIVWLAVGLTIVSLGCGKKDAASSGPGAAPNGGAAADLSYVTSEHVAAVVIRPRKILQNPLLQSLPASVFESFTKQTGVAPSDVVQFTILVRSSMIPDPGAPPTGRPESPLGVVQFAQPTDCQTLATRVWQAAASRTHAGRTYFIPGFLKDIPNSASMRVATAFQWDASTILFCEEPELKKIIDGATGPAALRDKLQQLGTADDLVAVADFALVRSRLQAFAAQGREQLPPSLQPYMDLADALDAAVIRANLSGDSLLTVDLQAKDGASAANVAKLAGDGLEMGKRAFAGLRPRLAAMAPPDIGSPLLKVADELIGGIQSTRSGNAVTIQAAMPPSLAEVAKALGPKLVQMTQLAQAAQQQATQFNNLKQIGLAMHNYHDTHGEFPTGIRAADGKLLLSWRVQLLPFLEHADLYKRFELDEPWDSEHNRALLDDMPDVFRTEQVAGTSTTYLAFVGEGGLFPLSGSIRLRDILDGTSNTLMVVEAGSDKAVPWTKPADLTLEPDNTWATLGAVGNQGFRGLMCDGSVKLIPKSLDAATLSALINPRDGRPIPDF